MKKQFAPYTQNFWMVKGIDVVGRLFRFCFFRAHETRLSLTIFEVGVTSG